MLVDHADVSAEEFRAGTGWKIEPEGACKGDVCVPLGAAGAFDPAHTAVRLGMAVVHDEQAGLWALGPESGGRAMTSVTAPELTLPLLTGEPFALSALRGKKVLIAAWASW